jgi:hypothetical protein
LNIIYLLYLPRMKNRVYIRTRKLKTRIWEVRLYLEIHVLRLSTVRLEIVSYSLSFTKP